jgi:hypothetical protein
MTTRAKTLPSQETIRPTPANDGRVSELRATASLMRLEAGLYCVVVAASPHADARTGLPGVRITKAPGPAGNPDAVEIRTIGADGWVSGSGDAALVRVAEGVAHVMVTIYQAPNSGAEGAPNIQVLPLINGPLAAPPTALPKAAPPLPAPEPAAAPAKVAMDVLAHIQTRGDVGAKFGDWLGEKGSGKWIEGFGIAPTNGVDLADIEYQVVLGRGWTSPWVEGGQFAGSRGMNLPILGLRARLLGEAAKHFELRYAARFIDGSEIGPVEAGEVCEAPSLAAVEAIRVEMTPKAAAQATPRGKKRGAKAG